MLESLRRRAAGGLRVGLLRSFEIDFSDDETLRLRVASRLPGQAWLEWRVRPAQGGCLLEQTVFFAPQGLPGFLGWYLSNPLQRGVFARLLGSI